MSYTIVNVASADSIEKKAQERRRKDEEECSRKFMLCLCYIALCCSCLLLVEAIVASIILYNIDDTTESDNLNVHDYEEGSWSWLD
tara:strand:+ start:614 stop:871 length:258 start_codon:yes stop_codon:yes gene_type:complete